MPSRLLPAPPPAAGLFVLSLVALARGQDLLGGALFAVLLCSKHIFLYAAPLYFVYLLRHYCAGPGAAARFVLLGSTVAAIFGAAFAPFVATGQAAALLVRLFPFGRGLVHAYWAPNVWALYAAADRALAALLPRLGIHVVAQAAGMTGGLVGVAQFAVLPQVGSGATAALALAAMAPCLLAVWRRPAPERFPAAALYCTMCSFMLGYAAGWAAAEARPAPGAQQGARTLERCSTPSPLPSPSLMCFLPPTNPPTHPPTNQPSHSPTHQTTLHTCPPSHHTRPPTGTTCMRRPASW